MGYKFDEDLRLERIDDDRFRARISGDWNIAAPNGGYLLAMGTLALERTLGYQQPLSLSATFHRPCTKGAAELAVRQVSRNPRVRTGTAALYQKGREVISFVGTFARENVFNGPSLLRRRPELPDASLCVPFPHDHLSLYRQVNLLLPEEQLDWTRGEQRGDTLFSGWLEFADGRPLDGLAAVLFADASPPPILRHAGPLFWVPTIQLSVQLRAVPKGTRLGFVAVTNFATSGLVEIDVELWSPAGEIIALGRQLAVVRRRKAALRER